MQPKSFSKLLSHFQNFQLINETELKEINYFFNEKFPFLKTLDVAESIHVHIKVDDTALLPHESILALKAEPQNQKEGYIKYAFDCGLNMIFSSIKVSEEDKLPKLFTIKKPMVDHLGIDIREESELTRQIFDSLACIGSKAGWRYVRQGGKDKPVYCCHVEVAEKIWLYPPENACWTRPLEFAYGALKLNNATMGCDLRPLDPLLANPLSSACGGEG